MRKRFNMFILINSLKRVAKMQYSEIIRIAVFQFILLVSTVISWSQSTLPVTADTLGIKGIILSDTRQPLSGISVSIEGSNQLPVLANEAGEFNIKGSFGTNWIIVKPSSGYKTKRVFVNDRSKLTVFLTANGLSSGDDPLYILSQNVPRRNMVAAYTDVDLSDIRHTAALSVDQYAE